jgi:hypothetical protein
VLCFAINVAGRAGDHLCRQPCAMNHVQILPASLLARRE